MEIKKILVNLSATIPTASYQNLKPMYQIEADLTKADDPKLCMEELRETIRKMFAQDFARLRNKDKVDYLNKCRFYEKDGKKLPSVTSILGWADLLYRLRNPDQFQFGGVGEDELQEYAARGTIVHTGVQEWFKATSGGKEEQKHDESRGRLQNQPSLTVEWSLVNESKLKVEDCNWQGFYDKFKEKIQIKFMERELHGDGYGGRLDMYGTWENEPAVFDIKTTSTYNERVKLKYFKQMSAYAAALKGVKKPKWLVIIPLNPSNKCGYGAPMVVENDPSLFKAFNEDLKLFQRDFADLV